jgi:Cullin family
MLAQVTNEALDQAMKSDDTEASVKNINNIVTLISCLEEKDRYLYYLSNNLSKRLLDNDLDSITSMEWEKQMIHAIKSKLGSEFSKNLEAMIIDVEGCYARKPAVQEYFRKHSNTSLIRDLHVNVLSNCDWVLPEGMDLQPPDNIILIQKLFEDFYTSDPTNLNRRLEWNYGQGLLEVKYNLQDKDYNLCCRPYQYFTLALFQKKALLSVSEITCQLKLKDWRNAIPIIESLLANPKILIKKEDRSIDEPKETMMNELGETDGNQLKETDFLILNPDFKSKFKRVTLRDAKFEDKSKKSNTVDNDRVQAIQGCIVRVLKSNKVMEYLEVVRNVEKLMLKFNPASKVRVKTHNRLLEKRLTSSSRRISSSGILKTLTGLDIWHNLGSVLQNSILFTFKLTILFKQYKL